MITYTELQSTDSERFNDFLNKAAVTIRGEIGEFSFSEMEFPSTGHVDNLSNEDLLSEMAQYAHDILYFGNRDEQAEKVKVFI